MRYYSWRRRRDYFAALHHLAKFAHARKPAYPRPPFCGGSNPCPRVRIHIIKHNKKSRHTGVFFIVAETKGFPRTTHSCRLRGNRDDLPALHWSNLLVVEPAICDCDVFAPFRFTGNNTHTKYSMLHRIFYCYLHSFGGTLCNCGSENICKKEHISPSK